MRYHTTVADDLDANVVVFRAAIDRADVVAASGGLGPTADDLTREVAWPPPPDGRWALDSARSSDIVSLFGLAAAGRCSEANRAGAVSDWQPCRTQSGRDGAGD